MTDGGSRASLFERVRSFEEGLKLFRKEVGEHEHACGEPEGCKEPVISFPNCYLLAYTMQAFWFASAEDDEEREEIQAMSMEEWFRDGLDLFERVEAREREDELRELGISDELRELGISIDDPDEVELVTDELRELGLDEDRLRELGVVLTVITVPDEIADDLGL